MGSPVSLASGVGIASDVLGIGEGIAQMISAGKKEREAKRELDALKKPFYKIQDEYKQNAGIAGNLAEGGLTSAEKNQFTTGAERGLSAGISATLQGGGSPSDIAKLGSVYDSAMSNEAAADSAAHLENIKYFMGANKELAGQKTTQWALNEYQPYEAKLKELTERRDAATKNSANGLDTAIGSVGALGTTLSNNDLYNKLFGKGDTKTPGSGTFNPNGYTAQPITTNQNFNPGIRPTPAAAGLFETPNFNSQTPYGE